MRVITNRFSSETILDEKKFFELFDSKYRLGQEKKTKQNILIIAVIIALIALLIVGFANSLGAWIARGIIILLTAAFVIWGREPVIEAMKKFVVKQSYSSAQNKNAQLNYGFAEDNFTVVHDNKHSVINYSQVKNITESQDAFVLWCDDKTGFVVDKKGFDFGNVSDFSDFISKKTGLNVLIK